MKIFREEKNYIVNFMMISFCETIKIIAADVMTIKHSRWGFHNTKFFKIY